MKTIEIGMKVTAHHGSASIGGMFISETFLAGEVIKVNNKSIRVHFTEETHTTNGKEISRKAIDRTETFTFWKDCKDGRSVYRKNLDCYRYLITF